MCQFHVPDNRCVRLFKTRHLHDALLGHLIYNPNMSALNPGYWFVEQRAKPRITCAYPAIVRGVAHSGTRFQDVMQLCDLSTLGMYLKSARALPVGQTLFLVFWFSSHPKPAQASALAARGTVVRTEVRADGSHGIALHLLRYRFI